MLWAPIFHHSFFCAASIYWVPTMCYIAFGTWDSLLNKIGKDSCLHGTYMIIERDGQFAINTVNELDSILESYSVVNKNIFKTREEGLGVRSNGMPGKGREGLWMCWVRQGSEVTTLILFLPGNSCGHHPNGCLCFLLSCLTLLL